MSGNRLENMSTPGVTCTSQLERAVRYQCSPLLASCQNVPEFTPLRQFLHTFYLHSQIILEYENYILNEVQERNNLANFSYR